MTMTAADPLVVDLNDPAGTNVSLVGTKAAATNARPWSQRRADRGWASVPSG